MGGGTGTGCPPRGYDVVSAQELGRFRVKLGGLVWSAEKRVGWATLVTPRRVTVLIEDSGGVSEESYVIENGDVGVDYGVRLKKGTRDYDEAIKRLDELRTMTT